MDQEQADRQITGLVMMHVKQFDDEELHALNMALLLGDFPNPDHAYYQTAISRNLITKTWAHEMTRSALESCVPHEVLRRSKLAKA